MAATDDGTQFVLSTTVLHDDGSQFCSAGGTQFVLHDDSTAGEDGRRQSTTSDCNDLVLRLLVSLVLPFQ